MSAAAFDPRPEEAFLGCNTRAPTVRYSFDGQRLVCWEVWWIRAGAIVAGALVGPGLTAALVAGWVNHLPWYSMAVLGAVSAVGWIGWIDALRHRYQIVGDLVGGQLHFCFHPRRPPVFSVDLKQIAATELVVINRSRRARVKPPAPEMIERYNLSTVDCHNLVVVLADGRRIYVLESTDPAIPQRIGRILEEYVGRGNRSGHRI